MVGRLAAILFVLASPASGQSIGPPVIESIRPPSLTVGQTAEWSITGRNLGAIRTVLVSGPGVEVVGFSPQGESPITVRLRVDPGTDPGYREVRVDGPNGVSNLAIVRVDTLHQVSESDRGNDLEAAQVIEVGSVVVGTLRRADLDHYRIKGVPGTRLTLDLEAGRVGTSFSPVMTILADSGAAIAQGRESRVQDRDCRLSAVVPASGSFLVEVRDNTYGGSDLARYRLRIDPRPFATAFFPIGGAKGSTVEVEVSGGNLTEPLRKSIRLPEVVGSTVEVGSVEGPGGAILAPGRLIVGDGPETSEPIRRPDDPPIPLARGLTLNGRIGRAGEVDRYQFPVKAGERVRLRAEASAMGSWLDSVLVVRDDHGLALAENDDQREADRPDPTRGVLEASTDSLVEFEAKLDGDLTVEVTDRFGDGGPEYGYRLLIESARPDFTVRLLVGDPKASLLAVGNSQAATVRVSPGQFGVYNLKPGSTVSIPFLIAPEGRPGPIEVRVEGLPDGATAEPVVVRLPGPDRPGPTPPVVADFLELKVARNARPGLSGFRVVASARPGPGPAIVRGATATVGVATVGVVPRPITRVVSTIPLRIVGEVRPDLVGPPRE